MSRLQPASIWAVWFGWFLPGSLLLAQISIEGVEDQEVYRDQVSFRVLAEAGFDYTVLLNGEPKPADVLVEIKDAEYYQLFVERRNTSTGAEESELVQFIVRDSNRRNSEWGLSPWVPYAPVDSAAAEFSGAELKIVTPREYPQGMEIPVIALVEDSIGNRVGVIGDIKAQEFPDHSIRILRGVGSGFLPPASTAGQISYTAKIQTIEATKQISLEDTTNWTEVSGNLSATANWGEDARIHITGDLTVAAGATLTIGAGGVIKIAPDVEITVDGKIVVEGTPERPAVFTPESRDAPWGGFLFLDSAARADLTGAIFTGSGADSDWFSGKGYSTHRENQALFLLDDEVRVNLTDCYIIHNEGQIGHGDDAFLTMTRCLIQRCVTTGQFNGGSVVMNHCALVEFPAWDAPFEDEDNDGIYLTRGSHVFTKCLIGWALDDGIDAGSGDGGSVEMTGCWIESCYHEGMAWSSDDGKRIPTLRDCVLLNCGQGIECGFGEPEVDADHCLSTANLVGSRFGDNYDWTYNGFLKVTNSLLLHNKRNIWGRNWADWTERLSQMDLHDNFLSEADPLHLNNTVWDPSLHADRLAPFLPAPDDKVGVGIAATTAGQKDLSQIPNGIPLRLSTFSTKTVSVEYTLESEAGSLGSGILEFFAGETVKAIPLQIPDPEEYRYIRVALSNPVNAEVTGGNTVDFVGTATLIPTNSLWKYLDIGEDQETAWRALDFIDSSWPEGRAELGFGDNDEETVINGGPSNDRYRTTYFRHAFQVDDPGMYSTLVINLRRDDGAVVYLNGEEVFRSNMPEDEEIFFSTFAETSNISETAFNTKEVGADKLRRDKNVIAVEVHQASTDSSDLSFELELTARFALLPASPLFVRGDANGDGFLDISDPIKILFVLFLGFRTDCEDALDVNDDSSLNITDVTYLLEYLFLRGEALPHPFPEAGEDLTDDGLTCRRS